MLGIGAGGASAMTVPRCTMKVAVIASVLVVFTPLTTAPKGAALEPSVKNGPSAVVKPVPALTEAQRTLVHQYMAAVDKHWQKGKFKECIEAATQVIRINPGYDPPYSYRGQSYYRMEEFGKAIADLDTFFKLTKTTADLGAHRARAISLMQVKKYNEALKDIDVCIKAQPGTWDFWQDETNAYLGLGQYDKAISSASQMIKLSPTHGHYSFRARIYSMAGKDKQAVDDWTQAISLTPEIPTYYHARAKCYDRLGLKNLAEADRKKRDDLSRAEL